MTEKIRIYRIIAASPERVYGAMISRTDLIHWYSAGGGWTTPYAESDPQEGGRLRIGFNDPQGKNSFDLLATYTKLQKPNEVEYVLDDGRKVEIRIDPLGEGSKVNWVFDCENSNSMELQRQGWQSMLDNLGQYLEKENGSKPAQC